MHQLWDSEPIKHSLFWLFQLIFLLFFSLICCLELIAQNIFWRLQTSLNSHYFWFASLFIKLHFTDSGNAVLETPGEFMKPQSYIKKNIWKATLFWPCEIWSRGTGWAHPSFWPTELWNNQFVLLEIAKFVVTCYSSNGKLMHSICYNIFSLSRMITCPFSSGNSMNDLCFSALPWFLNSVIQLKAF